MSRTASSTGTVTFWLADTPPSLNAIGSRGSHWAVTRAKKRWQLDIEMSLMALRVPRGLEYVEASATLRFPVKRQRDIDNHTWLLAKSCGDALVNYGVIPKDTPEFFRFTGIEFENEKGDRRTTVRLDTREAKR